DKVVLKHLAGTDPITYERMIPEQRAMFEAQRERGLEFQMQGYARAAAVDDMRQKERSAEQASARAREELAAQIDAAISEHRLLVGMTMDQVKRSWGLPTRTVAVDGTNGQGVMWVYDGRGMDTHGNVTTAGIGFIGDAVVQLFNVKAR
ncbi:MAG: hypothetical protein JWM35_1442, partial [Verrucomicrobia bacterium]|nr:hypothetical protein [Verrucomicrobiota bacterium]